MYRSLKREIRSFYKDKPPRKILASLGELARCINKRSLDDLYLVGKQKRVISNQLRQFAEWVVLFRKELLDGTLTD